MKDIILSQLKKRSTKQLKNDILTAKNSTDENSAIIFVLGLNLLEERLSEYEYKLFEDEL